jgi:CheY-like chemotaxis protein
MTTQPLKPKNLKILIIEDSPIIMEVHKELVKLMGYQSDCAMNGAQAIKHFRNRHYDIILTDLGLPDIDGMQLAERFRLTESMENRPKSIIVAITAFVLDDVREQCFYSGINEVLAKPLNLSALEAAFQRAADHFDAIHCRDKVKLHTK